MAITNEQKIAMLKASKNMGHDGKRLALAIIMYLEQNPECEDLNVAYRAAQLERAIVMYRERWATGWTTEDIQIFTGFHRKDIHRELKRRNLSPSSEYEQKQ